MLILKRLPFIVIMPFLIFAVPLGALPPSPLNPIQPAIQDLVDSLRRCDAILQNRRTGPPKFPIALPTSPASARGKLIAEYLNVTLTNRNQNRSWIELALSEHSRLHFSFFEFELAKLKYLNDHLIDKDLVTAITHFYKQKIKTRLMEAFPDVAPQWIWYNDFKALRFALPLAQTTPLFEQKLNTLFTEVNREFTLELIEKGIVRRDDEPYNWFRLGQGQTADQANIAARFSRNLSENKLTRFSDPETQTALLNYLKRFHQLAQDLRTQGFTETPLNRNWLESIRKNNTPTKLIRVARRKHNVTISEAQAQLLLDYLEAIDRFSASLYVEEREIVTAQEARHGAISLDFLGLGSYNLYETSIGLARSQDVATAVQEARAAEQRVTTQFKKAVQEKIKTIKSYLVAKRKHQSLRFLCSGDDCLFILSTPLKDKERRDLIQRLSKTERPSAIRMAIIDDKVTLPEMRNHLASHGEAIEKILRDLLIDYFHAEVLDQILLAIVMHGTASNMGDVELIIGNAKQKLERHEWVLIHSLFTEAVKKMNNAILENTQIESRYTVRN